MASATPSYTRPQTSELLKRLREPRRFLQIVTGPRQVGKTTLLHQVAERARVPHTYASADEPTLRGPEWIARQWHAARIEADYAGAGGSLLMIDEVQKAPNWAESVKRLWDEDTRAGRPLRVVLSGSAQLLIGRGLTESLAGRFELLRMPHWSFGEMRTVFGWTLEQFLHFGAYPAATPLVTDPERWSRYIRDSLIETTIARDLLLLTKVAKPILLRRLFELACAYSGQILSYSKMVGQLQDAGNTTTLAHYLDLLAGTGLVTGLQKFSGTAVRRRASSPKLIVLNTALMTALSGLTPEETAGDRGFRGRLVESAVGAHLLNGAAAQPLEVYYWRHRNREVDFVVRAGPKVTAIEVKSGRARANQPGLHAFSRHFQPDRTLVVSGDEGGNGIALERFLEEPAGRWVG